MNKGKLRGSKKLSSNDYDIIRRVDSLHCSKYKDCDYLKSLAESDYAKQYIDRKKDFLKYLLEKK